MIRFVRKYVSYGRTYFDVIRKSRVNRYDEENVPKNVIAFMENSCKVHSEYDQIFKRQETIYE